MSSGEQQLQADFALVKQLLQDYPCIKLVATKGDPPEQYDIEYNLKGYKASSDGTILPANKHLVRITLPFGYPHFPPTAKPLSPIFHPDIDPDAIRIADFWKEGRALPELIIHIGQMICGTFYSSDPFNQRAFDWFEERKSWMPFDILEPHEGDEDESPFLRAAKVGGEAAAAAQQPIAPVAEKGPEPVEEEIPLDFAIEGEPLPETGQESTELDNLLDGEFSFAFDLEEQEAETPAGGGEMEDLTALSEEETFAGIAATPEATEPIVDLTGPLEETPDLDLGLEQDQASVELHLEDLSEGEAVDFSGTFALEKETEAPKEEAIELGDIADLETEPLGGLESLVTDILEEGGEGTPDLPQPEDFSVDFGIAGASQESGEEVTGQEETADQMLGGISLQLDEEHGKKFGAQSRSIRPLIEQKEIFTAKRVLADISDPSQIPDWEELELAIASAISEAEELYKKADRLEQKGELEKAGLLLDLVANIAVDYPGLDFARNRIRESMMAGGQQKTTADKGKTAAGEQADTATAEKSPAKKMAIPKLRVKVPVKLLGVLLVLGGIAGGGSFLYLRDTASLEMARTEYRHGQQLAEKMEFKEAEKAFNASRAELGSILLFARGGGKDLSKAIDAMVTAQNFKEGLQGKVLYNGEYVTIAAAKAIDSYTQHAASAEKARQKGNIDQAIASYEKSLEFAEEAGFKDKVVEIRQTISILRLEQAMSLARKAEEEKEWKQAADAYQHVLELSSSLGNTQEQSDIAKLQTAATLRYELEEGKRAFTASEWQAAVEMLQRAQELIVADPTLVAEPEQREINKLLINAQVYRILADAKNAFTQKDWDGTISAYGRAISFLREKEEVLGGEEVTDSVGKIEKTILMTQISREQSRIERGVTESGKLAANLARYRTIASLIEKSPLKEDTVLQEIHRDAKAQIVNLEKEILVIGKVEYLKKRFETIFREHYPSAKSSELLAPQVTFIKREGKIMIFRMSCSERNQGRTFRLELNYQYDQNKDSWSLYSGKL